MMETINETLDKNTKNGLTQNRLDRQFETLYPKLKSDVDNIISQQQDNESSVVDTIDNVSNKAIEEILAISRESQNILNRLDSSTHESVKLLMGWLYSHSNIVRKAQIYDFELEDTQLKKDSKSAVKITGRHSYVISNTSSETPLLITTDLIDELGTQSAEDGWGFIEARYRFVKNDDSYDVKHPFEIIDRKKLNIKVVIPPLRSVVFEFKSIGVFFTTDRYTWYSQDICEGCKITITNKTQNVEITRYQINHRDEKVIKPEGTNVKNCSIIDFNLPIFPREGFAMYWKSKQK